MYTNSMIYPRYNKAPIASLSLLEGLNLYYLPLTNEHFKSIALINSQNNHHPFRIVFCTSHMIFVKKTMSSEKFESLEDDLTTLIDGLNERISIKIPSYRGGINKLLFLFSHKKNPVCSYCTCLDCITGI